MARTPSIDHLNVQPTLLDRAIGYLSPRTAARRLVARQQLALVGGYNGARKDRAALSAWRTSAGSPETDVIADLHTLRDRCADLERNAPVASSIIGTHCTHVVGTGLACNPQIDAEFLGVSRESAAEWQKNVKRRFTAWAESPDCDLARELNFYEQQDLALRTTLSRGDAFVLTPRVQRQGGRAQLALQLLEGDFVCNPNQRANTDTLTEGIEHAPETGETIAVHVASIHPGNLRHGSSRTWQRVAVRGDKTGRRNVLHVYRTLRPGLRRGVPILAPVIEPIKKLTKYSEAELDAAVASAVFAVFLRMDPEAFDTLFDDKSQEKIIDRASDWSGEMEGGKAVNLLPGEEPVSHSPNRPNAQFDAFTTSCMRQIGMAIGLPYEVLVMHFQSSYSAARGALLLAWKHFIGWRAWLATKLCQPVYELWLADEVAEGRISAPGFFSDAVLRSAWCRAQWVGDGPGSIDPEREVKAAGERVALGISTLEAESLLHDGVDWETKHGQLIKEAAARRGQGFSVRGDASAPPDAAASHPSADRTDPANPADANDGNGDDPPQSPVMPTSPQPAPARRRAAMQAEHI